MALAGVLADLINLPSIVGAFLAGVAVNAAAHEHPAKGKLEFVSRALFIPIFFIVTGFLIAPIAVVQTIVEFGVIQIVDIALQAVSPAANDPSTAISCVDRRSPVPVGS
jgi:Kef-type K+ transport system membrane component KefB